jgi:hypothetical protein
MSCSECVDLGAKRYQFFREYMNAVAVLNASWTAADAEHHRELQATADEARINFSRADAAFRQHQDRHAVPN